MKLFEPPALVAQMTLLGERVENEPPPVVAHVEKVAPAGALAFPAVSFQKFGLALGSKFEPAVTVWCRTVPAVPFTGVAQVAS